MRRSSPRPRIHHQKEFSQKPPSFSDARAVYVFRALPTWMESPLSSEGLSKEASDATRLIRACFSADRGGANDGRQRSLLRASFASFAAAAQSGGGRENGENQGWRRSSSRQSCAPSTQGRWGRLPFDLFRATPPTRCRRSDVWPLQASPFRPVSPHLAAARPSGRAAAKKAPRACMQ